MKHLVPRVATLVVPALALVLVAACGGDDYRPRPKTEKKLIILGIDGMDPVLLQKYMDEGRVPNLKKMADNGSFLPLGTTDPPQSPVAWSAFITGLDLDGHGIYDFVHRDPIHLESYLSTSKPTAATTMLGFIPDDPPGHKLLRGGKAFWQVLEEEKIGATMVKIPANFPPAKSRANESMSGMGTPDMLGTYGTFQMFTDEPEWDGKHVSAGEIHMVDFSKTQVVHSTLVGPGSEAEIEIAVDKEAAMALLSIGSEKVLLKAGEWSAWTPVDFGAGLMGGGTHGIVRFFLRGVSPFRLYVSPINTDPAASDLHISEPPSWAEDMAKNIGRFYTQGMAEDTKALVGGVLTDEEFLSQTELVFEERIKMLRHEMKRYEDGLLFFYFSSIDQTSHMYYGSLEPDAPEHYARYKHVVPELYTRMDKVVGEVLEWAGDTPVAIMSDHGFAPWTYKVNLNTWLAQQGYLALLPPDKVVKGNILGHIDWENTQAYALGLNQLFLNVKGREAHGVIPDDEREVVIQRLKRDLESWRYAETGERVVTKAIPAPVGQYGDRAPDLIVGYNRGYRSSDSSAMGAVGIETIERNEGHWNGDHCMHASHVPGVLLSTIPVVVDKPTLLDFAPTVLNYFGIKPPEGMKGQLLFGEK